MSFPPPDKGAGLFPKSAEFLRGALKGSKHAIKSAAVGAQRCVFLQPQKGTQRCVFPPPQKGAQKPKARRGRLPKLGKERAPAQAAAPAADLPKRGRIFHFVLDGRWRVCGIVPSSHASFRVHSGSEGLAYSFGVKAHALAAAEGKRRN